MHAGVQYQHFSTLAAWLHLGPDEKIFVEGANDFDRIGFGGAVSTDTHLRDEAQSITLRDKKVHTALGNAFRILIKENGGRKVSFRLVCNSVAGVEQGAPFGTGVAGLSAWSKAAEGDVLLRKRIVEFLGTQTALPFELRNFLRKRAASDSWDEFLSRISFDTCAPGLSAIEMEIDQLLQERLKVGPVERESFDVKNAKGALFGHICRLAASKTPSAPLTVDLLGSIIQAVTLPAAAWAQITYQSFLPLDDWMSQFVATGVSRSDLFRNELVHFSEDDEAVIDQIMDQMTHPAAVVSLTGVIGTGKSMLAAEVGRRLAASGFAVYHHAASLSESIGEFERQVAGFDSDRTQLGMRPRLLIVDDSHRQPALLRQIWDRRRRWRQTAFLFVSVQTSVASKWNLDDVRDVTSELPDESRVQMPSVESTRFFQKIERIVDRFRVWRENQLGKPVRVGDLRRIVPWAQASLVAFIEASLSWDQETELASLQQDSARQVFSGYLHSLPEDEKELLLLLASIAQFEEAICFVPPAMANSARGLLRAGIIVETEDDPQKGVSFPHRQNASLLLSAHLRQYPAETASARRLDCLQRYLIGSDEFGNAIPSLLLALALQGRPSDLTDLLNNRDIAGKVERSFLVRPLNETIDFLFVARRTLTREVLGKLLKRLVWTRVNAMASLKVAEAPVVQLKRLLVASQTSGSTDIEQFESFATTEVISAAASTSDFHSVSWFIWTISQRRRHLATKWLRALPVHALAGLVRQAGATELVQGIERLAEVDAATTRTVFAEAMAVENAALNDVLSSRFDCFADTLARLNRIDEITVHKILSSLTVSDLERMTDSCSTPRIAVALSLLKDVNKHLATSLLDRLSTSKTRNRIASLDLNTAGNTLAELAKVDGRTAKKLLRNLTPAELAIWGRRAPLVRLGKSFAELAKVDHRMTQAALAMMDWSNLVRKVRECNELPTISKALSELHKVDRDIAESLLDMLDQTVLVEMCRKARPDVFGRSLRELGVLSTQLPTRIVAQISPKEVATSLLASSIVQIGHTLAELTAVVPTFSSNVLDHLPTSELVRLAHSEGRFLSLCSVFSMLAKVPTEPPGKAAFELLRLLGVDHFANKIRHLRFEEIGLGLSRLHGIDSKMAETILERTDKKMLETKGRKEQAAKAVNALHALSHINKRIATSLTEALVDERFVRLLMTLQPAPLAQCLNELGPIDPNIPREVLSRFDRQSFSRLFQTTPHRTKVRIIGDFQRLAPKELSVLHSPPHSRNFGKPNRPR